MNVLHLFKPTRMMHVMNQEGKLKSNDKKQSLFSARHPIILIVHARIFLSNLFCTFEWQPVMVEEKPQADLLQLWLSFWMEMSISHGQQYTVFMGIVNAFSFYRVWFFECNFSFLAFYFLTSRRMSVALPHTFSHLSLWMTCLYQFSSYAPFLCNTALIRLYDYIDRRRAIQWWMLWGIWRCATLWNIAAANNGP